MGRNRLTWGEVKWGKVWVGRSGLTHGGSSWGDKDRVSIVKFGLEPGWTVGVVGCLATGVPGGA